MMVSTLLLLLMVPPSVQLSSLQCQQQHQHLLPLTTNTNLRGHVVTQRTKTTTMLLLYSPTSSHNEGPAAAVRASTIRSRLSSSHRVTKLSTTTTTRRMMVTNNNSNNNNNPTSSSSKSSSLSAQQQPLYPQIGDIVRYYDLDGGKVTGQVLVGKITYIFRTSSANTGSTTTTNNNNYNYNNYNYIAELVQLEDVKDGYYSEYSSTKRSGKKTERRLDEISPILASYVQSEQAYKVPIEVIAVDDTGGPTTTDSGKTTTTTTSVPRRTTNIKVRQEKYDLEDYPGPTPITFDKTILLSDQERYDTLKFTLLKNTAIVGLGGTVIVDLVKSTEDATIYLAGVVASILYLFLLSVKTDTMANSLDGGQNRLGSPLANGRFLMPVLLLVGIAAYNKSRGEMNPLLYNGGMFDTVTKEQFAFAVLGFLTYRIPLFIGQIQKAFVDIDGGVNDDSNQSLPGSAGIALKAMQQQQEQASSTGKTKRDGMMDLVTILLVSGPQATGRSELVQRLLDGVSDGTINITDDKGGMLVPPQWVKRVDNGETFERLQRREEFLQLNPLATMGLTKQGIFDAASSNDGGGSDGGTYGNVVVVDANVDLARKLQRLAGARLVGVWVGLETVKDFEQRLEDDISTGRIAVPPEETKESVIRGRIKEIISEIEYGLSSGIFEFTILNSDPDKSLKELKEAAAYAFR